VKQQRSSIYCSSRSFSNKLTLIAQAACRAHPEKATKHPHGDDAFFVGPDSVGVADGVSAWAQVDVDAGVYARELMSLCKEELDAMEGVKDPKMALQNAYKRSLSSKSSSLGTCTACVATLETDGLLRAANIGDSGFIVIRKGQFREAPGFDVEKSRGEGWEVVYRSADMQKFFNCPDQLGSGSPDRPARAESYELPVEAGDVLIVATDGLFDNFSDNEICITMKRLCSDLTSLKDVAFHQASSQTEGLSECLSEVATHFVEQSHVIGMSETARTPFTKHALRAGYFYEGGKLDDTAVVVALVAAKT